MGVMPTKQQIELGREILRGMFGPRDKCQGANDAKPCRNDASVSSFGSAGARRLCLACAGWGFVG